MTAHEPQCPAERLFLPWKDGGMVFQATLHAARPNFVAGWVRDLPGIAVSMGQPNAESVLRRALPLQGCLESAVHNLTLNGADNVPTLGAALEFVDTPKLASHWCLAVLARTRTQLDSGSTDEHIVAAKASSGSGAGSWM